MMVAKYSQGRRGNRSSGGRPWQFSLWSLLVLITVCAVLLGLSSVLRKFPLQALIMGTVLAITVTGVILYIGELYVIGWVVDFLADLGMPKFHARSAPLDCELVGEIIVVTLRDNIATAAQCQAVAKQLKHLTDDHHCDFILDFLYAGRIAIGFREVMLDLLKAARKEAEKPGKAGRSCGLPQGDTFRVFDDRQQALEEMAASGGHGWVALCSVPVGVRAVSELM
jgi:hypothetical protein